MGGGPCPILGWGKGAGGGASIVGVDFLLGSTTVKWQLQMPKRNKKFKGRKQCCGSAWIASRSGLGVQGAFLVWDEAKQPGNVND